MIIHIILQNKKIWVSNVEYEFVCFVYLINDIYSYSYDKGFLYKNYNMFRHSHRVPPVITNWIHCEDFEKSILIIANETQIPQFDLVGPYLNDVSFYRTQFSGKSRAAREQDNTIFL